MKKIILMANLIISILFTSCDNSVSIKDGFTVYGKITDQISGSVIPEVAIKSFFDSTKVGNGEIIKSDSLGEFMLVFGPGTAPTEEIVLCEHADYESKEIKLKENVSKNGDKYSLAVKLVHK